MPEIVRTFNGKLNYDDHPYRMPKGDYTDALNVTRDSEGLGTDEIMVGITGNELVNFTLPSGVNKTIGSKEDKVRNRVYIFRWNSNNYHTISFYDATTNTITKLVENLTDTGNVDVLGFNPSYRINHIDIVYRDSGDLLFWTDGLNPPSKINVETARTGGYGTIIRSFINVIKEPPQIPPQTIYEDDNTVTVNNLRKKLFRFKYRYVFDDGEKSVWSSISQLPLPVNYTDSAVDTDPAKNCRIALVMQTGETNVTKIEVAAQQSLGNTYSDFFLVKVLDKTADGISDNDITTYRFYNNEAYVYVPILESLLPFDAIPQKSYTQALPNGNVLCYAALAEGYDLTTISGTTSVSNIAEQTTQLPYLFVASQSGNTGFGTGNIHIKVLGSVVSGDVFNIYTTSAIITYTSLGTTTAAVIAGLSAAAVVAGFTVVSSDSENIVITKTNESLQLITTTPTLRAPSDSFGWDYNCKENLALIYFDAEGRTNSALTTNGLVVQTNGYSESGGTQQINKINLSITSRPPLWAAYYHVLFTKNTTESDLLYWVSDRTYKDTEFAYIGIENLVTFIKNNPQTSVGYTFTVGDRIRFVKVLSGSVNTIYSQKDFEIRETVTDPNINGVVQEGLFVKIALPTTSGTFDFGTSDFFNYFIKLYTPAQSVANGLDVYYEMNQRYYIGNAGTANAFHQGMLQNQTANLLTPATFEFTQGDYYYRKRTINTGAEYNYEMYEDEEGVARYTLGVSFQNQTYSDPNILTGNSPLQSLAGFDLATNNDRWLIKIGTGTYKFRLKGSINVTVYDSYQNFYFYLETNNSVKTEIVPYQGLSVGNHVFTFDVTFQLTTGERIFAFGYSFDDFINSKRFFATDWQFTRELPFTVGVLDPNFSDYFQSAVNSFGRSWVYDPNAKYTYYPTLRRHGQEYEQDTATNNINRFYNQDQDTYDRSNGDIMKMYIVGRSLYVFHQFDIGVVSILTQIVKDTAGNPLSAESDKLLNKIQYPFSGKIGIGNVPESFAHGKTAMYGVDNNKGVVWRLGGNGLNSLSVLYKVNSFFVAKLSGFRTDLNIITPETGNPTVYGVFDQYTNKYIVALEAIDRTELTQDAYTLTFLETRDQSEGFESKLSYHPENMVVLNNLLITFKDGGLWTHNSNTYNNFYGVQYSQSITGVFSDAGLQKKTFEGIMETANDIWECTDIQTNSNSYSITPQRSHLIPANFRLIETEYYSSFKRDVNSMGGWINGSVLKGNYIIIKLEKKNASNFVYLNTVSVSYIESPLNKR